MPSTPRKIAANRANAQKSTGPRTPDGRARAAQNSLKHGLNSDRVLVPDELYSEFEEFRQALLEEFQPATPDQALLFEHMAAAAWRLRRIRRIETDMFDALLTQKSESLRYNYEKVDLDHVDLRNALLFRDCSEDFLRLSHYESRIYHQYRRNRADLIAAKAAAAKAQSEAAAQAREEAEAEARAKAEAKEKAEAIAEAKASAKAKAAPAAPAAPAPPRPARTPQVPSNLKKTDKIRVIGFVPPNSAARTSPPPQDRSTPHPALGHGAIPHLG
jgi:chemotaxis protein histidine kinase CheA